MTLKNAQILAMVNAIGLLANTALPAKASYALLKNMRKLGDQVKVVDEMRGKLIKTHAGEGAEQIKQEDAGWPKFVEDYTAILGNSEEVDVHKIAFTEFGDAKVSPAVLDALEPMLEV